MNGQFKKIPSVERLREVIEYDAITGVMVWKVDMAGRKTAGTVAGHVSQHGYRIVQIDGQAYPAHRIAFTIYFGRSPKQFLDHINCVRDDNRIENLREADAAQNARNSQISVRNKTGIKGVSLRVKTQRWVAQIRLNRKNITLGEFKDIEDAKAAYQAASKKLHGEFGRC